MVPAATQFTILVAIIDHMLPKFMQVEQAVVCIHVHSPDESESQVQLGTANRDVHSGWQGKLRGFCSGDDVRHCIDACIPDMLQYLKQKAEGIATTIQGRWVPSVSNRYVRRVIWRAESAMYVLGLSHMCISSSICGC